MIEENSHLRGCQSAACRMFQHSACLLKANAREQGGELVDWNTVFEILEKRRNRYAGATKHPCSADTLRVAFRSRAG